MGGLLPAPTAIHRRQPAHDLVQFTLGQAVAAVRMPEFILGTPRVVAQPAQLPSQLLAILGGDPVTTDPLARPVGVLAQLADPVFLRRDLRARSFDVLPGIVDHAAIGIAGEEVRFGPGRTDAGIAAAVASGLEAAVGRAVFLQPAFPRRQVQARVHADAVGHARRFVVGQARGRMTGGTVLVTGPLPVARHALVPA